MQKSLVRAAVMAAGLLVSASTSFGFVLYDSLGFETSGGYQTRQFLTGQPQTAAATDRWVQSTRGATGTNTRYATVETYPASSPPNVQYVTVGASNVPAENANFFNPLTNVINPFTPGMNQGVAITWTMATLSSNLANNPFFGMTTYGNGNLVAVAGVDASTGELIGGENVIVVKPFTITADTVYSYELLLNYDTQTYSIFTALAGGSFTLNMVGSFENAATEFTDAAITAFSLQGEDGADYSGYAEFDYYRVETVVVPEPASLGIAVVAFGLLVKRRRQTQSV